MDTHGVYDKDPDVHLNFFASIGRIKVYMNTATQLLFPSVSKA